MCIDISDNRHYTLIKAIEKVRSSCNEKLSIRGVLDKFTLSRRETNFSNDTLTSVPTENNFIP